ncbi:MAG: hypothetical protein QF464_24485, partial [Myxococcota bacterium]|nr:hypothetical protein [Myxococcota bacterium]
PTGELAITGSLVTSVDALDFDRAEVTARHKLDVDVAEDGCLTEVTLTLSMAVGELTGCVFQATAGGTLLGGQSLTIQSVTFTADSLCPGFDDAVEGVYTAGSTLVGTLTPTETTLPGAVDETDRCWSGGVTLVLSGELVRDDGLTLENPCPHPRVRRDVADEVQGRYVMIDAAGLIEEVDPARPPPSLEGAIHRALSDPADRAAGWVGPFRRPGEELGTNPLLSIGHPG